MRREWYSVKAGGAGHEMAVEKKSERIQSSMLRYV